MKPFDLEAAKAGKPICTRQGIAVEFIAHVPNAKSRHQLLVLLGEEVYRYHPDGCYFPEHDESGIDLFMAPVKRTLWVNLYRDESLFYMSGGVHNSQKEAERAAFSSNYIATVSFEVEE